jgi:hypothetical protein
MNFYEMLDLLENATNTLNLLKNREDVFAALELMEGRFWLAEELRATIRNNARKDCCSLMGALEWLETRGGLVPGFNPDGLHYFDFNPSMSYCIYGDGGYNRYFVKTDGSVRFSAGHAKYPSKETIKKAKDLGFDVFGEMK